VVDAHPEHMEMLLRKIERWAAWSTYAVRASPHRGRKFSGPVTSRRCVSGCGDDYKPLITTMLSVADGVSVVTENLFVGRFRYVDELVRLGASITPKASRDDPRRRSLDGDLGARQ